MTNKPSAVAVAMLETLPKNGASDAEWVIDCDVTMKEKRDFSKSITALDPATGVDEAALYPFFAKVVKRWPYAGDPADVESYDALRISQMQEVTRRVMAEFQHLTA